MPVIIEYAWRIFVNEASIASFTSEDGLTSCTSAAKLKSLKCFSLTDPMLVGVKDANKYHYEFIFPIDFNVDRHIPFSKCQN